MFNSDLVTPYIAAYEKDLLNKPNPEPVYVSLQKIIGERVNYQAIPPFPYRSTGIYLDGKMYFTFAYFVSSEMIRKEFYFEPEFNYERQSFDLVEYDLFLKECIQYESLPPSPKKRWTQKIKNLVPINLKDILIGDYPWWTFHQSDGSEDGRGLNTFTSRKTTFSFEPCGNLRQANLDAKHTDHYCQLIDQWLANRIIEVDPADIVRTNELIVHSKGMRPNAFRSKTDDAE